MRRCTLRSTRVARDLGGRLRIPAVIALVAVSALALAGCAGNPDVTDLEAQLSEVDGVNDATVAVTHSNFPWETQLVVTLYLEDSSDAGIAGAVRSAAPVFVADPVGSRHEVTLAFVPGRLSDFEDEFDAQRAELTVSPEVYTTLGIDGNNPYSITLSPAQMRAIADGE